MFLNETHTQYMYNINNNKDKTGRCIHLCGCLPLVAYLLPYQMVIIKGGTRHWQQQAQRKNVPL